MLGDVLEHIYFEDRVSIRTVDTRNGKIKEERFGPCARQQMQWDLHDHDIDEYDVTAYAIDVIDGHVEVAVEFPPFEHWADWKQTRRRARVETK